MTCQSSVSIHSSIDGEAGMRPRRRGSLTLSAALLLLTVVAAGGNQAHAQEAEISASQKYERDLALSREARRLHGVRSKEYIESQVDLAYDAYDLFRPITARKHLEDGLKACLSADLHPGMRAELLGLLVDPAEFEEDWGAANELLDAWEEYNRTHKGLTQFALQELLTKRAMILESMGEFEGAIRYYRASGDSFKKASGLSSAWSERAADLLEKQGKHSLAAEERLTHVKLLRQHKGLSDRATIDNSIALARHWRILGKNQQWKALVAEISASFQGRSGMQDPFDLSITSRLKFDLADELILGDGHGLDVEDLISSAATDGFHAYEKSKREYGSLLVYNLLRYPYDHITRQYAEKLLDYHRSSRLLGTHGGIQSMLHMVVLAGKTDDQEALARLRSDAEACVLGAVNQMPPTAASILSDLLAELEVASNDWSSLALQQKLCDALASHRDHNDLLDGRLSNASSRLSYYKSLLRSNRRAMAAQEMASERKAARRELLAAMTHMPDQDRRRRVAGLSSLRTDPGVRLCLADPVLRKNAGVTAEWVINHKSMNAAAERAARPRAGTPRNQTDSAESADWIHVQSLKASLPGRSTLVVIACVPETLGTGDWKPAYFAWIIPPRGLGSVQVIKLSEFDEVNRLVADCRKCITRSSGNRSRSEDEAAVKLAMGRLSEKVLTPLLDYIPDDCKQIVLSPDSDLWLVPWAALNARDGQPLARHYSVVYAENFYELGQPRTPAARRNFAAVFGDPDYDLLARGTTAKLAAVDSSSILDRSVANVVRFSRLPGTRQEIEAIKPQIEMLTGQRAAAYLGSEATESTFKSLKGPEILVLSTHGFFYDYAYKEWDTVEGVASLQAKELPLLRCGLALAGANRAKQVESSYNDGLLTGLEVLSSDLRGTKLAVLSACDTGIGEIREGAGVAGLREAFQLAGAESILSTLWAIPDEESAAQMESYFRLLAEGHSTGEALRLAQIEQIEALERKHGYAHPYLWAAFTLSGKDAPLNQSSQTLGTDK